MGSIKSSEGFEDTVKPVSGTKITASSIFKLACRLQGVICAPASFPFNRLRSAVFFRLAVNKRVPKTPQGCKIWGEKEDEQHNWPALSGARDRVAGQLVHHQNRHATASRVKRTEGCRHSTLLHAGCGWQAVFYALGGIYYFLVDWGSQLSHFGPITLSAFSSSCAPRVLFISGKVLGPLFGRGINWNKQKF